MRTRPHISLLTSFRVAFSGLVVAIREQRNLKIHLAITVAVVSLGLWLSLTAHDWMLLGLCIGNVLAMELMNTAVETVVDLASPESHRLAQKAKDIAAAAVLATSMMAAVIGVVILGTPLLSRWMAAP